MKKSKNLFIESGILSEDELHAHYDVRLEEYALKIQIESRTLAEMCMNQVLPAAINYQNILIMNQLIVFTHHPYLNICTHHGWLQRKFIKFLS